MAKLGRKPIYNKDLVAEVKKQLSIGMSRGDVWQIVGVSESQFYVWMNKFPEFEEAVRSGEFACKQRAIVRIQNAMKRSWAAATWWLSRKFPDEFADRSKTEHTIKGSLAMRKTTVIKDLSRLDEATLRALARKVAASNAGE